MSGEHRQWKKIRYIVFLLSKSFVSFQFRRGEAVRNKSVSSFKDGPLGRMHSDGGWLAVVLRSERKTSPLAARVNCLHHDNQ